MNDARRPYVLRGETSELELRDFFAGFAIAGMVRSAPAGEIEPSGATVAAVAKAAYKYADAMVAARGR
jgi:hypothetical protein